VAGGLRWGKEIVAILATITIFWGRFAQNSGFLAVFFGCVVIILAYFGFFPLFGQISAKFGQKPTTQPQFFAIFIPRSTTQPQFFAIFRPLPIPRAPKPPSPNRLPAPIPATSLGGGFHSPFPRVAYRSRPPSRARRGSFSPLPILPTPKNPPPPKKQLTIVAACSRIILTNQ